MLRDRETQPCGPCGRLGVYRQAALTLDDLRDPRRKIGRQKPPQELAPERFAPRLTPDGLLQEPAPGQQVIDAVRFFSLPQA
jgi:hypothetical protein